MKTLIVKEGRVWRWELKRGRKVLFGGYCRTKKDAANDASVVKRQNTAKDAAESPATKMEPHYSLAEIVSRFNHRSHIQRDRRTVQRWLIKHGITGSGSSRHNWFYPGAQVRAVLNLNFPPLNDLRTQSPDPALKRNGRKLDRRGK